MYDEAAHRQAFLRRLKWMGSFALTRYHAVRQAEGLLGQANVHWAWRQIRPRPDGLKGHYELRPEVAAQLDSKE
jgi:hypothetical protein